MDYSVYNINDGTILRTGTTTFASLAEIASSTEGVIIGTRLDWTKYCVDQDGYVVPKVVSSPVELEISKIMLRNQRNKLLNEVDLVWCNAERWAGYTDVQRSEWADYKQRLREFPDTCPDLANPVWPTPPQ